MTGILYPDAREIMFIAGLSMNGNGVFRVAMARPERVISAAYPFLVFQLYQRIEFFHTLHGRRRQNDDGVQFGFDFNLQDRHDHFI